MEQWILPKSSTPTYFRLKKPHTNPELTFENMSKYPPCAHPSCIIRHRKKLEPPRDFIKNEPGPNKHMGHLSLRKDQTHRRLPPYNSMEEGRHTIRGQWFYDERVIRPSLNVLYKIEANNNSDWCDVKSHPLYNNKWTTASWKINRITGMIKWKRNTVEDNLFCHQYVQGVEHNVIRRPFSVYVVYAIVKLVILLKRARKRIQIRKSYAICLRATHVNHKSSPFGLLAGTIHYPIKKLIFLEYGMMPEIGGPARLLKY